MTASRGIGRGNSSGGRNSGAGRPVGAINKRTRAVIDEAKRDRQLLPLDHLLSVMRDSELPLHDRTFASVREAAIDRKSGSR